MNLRKILERLTGAGPAASIAKKGGSFLINHAIGIVILFSLSSYITRNYGSEYWGKVALMMTIVTLGAVISTVGLDVYLVRLLGLPRTKAYKASLIKQIALGVTGIALAMTVIVFLCKGFISSVILSDPGYEGYVQMAAFCIPAAVITLVCRALLRSDKRSGLDGLLKNTFHWIIVGLSLLVALYNFDLEIDSGLQKALTVGFYASALVSMSLAWYYFSRSENSFEVELQDVGPKLSLLVLASYPLFLVAVMHNMNIGLDKFIVAAQLSIGDVGLYDIIIKVNALTGIVFLAVNSTLSPRVAELHGSNSSAEIEKVAVASTKVILLATLPLILGGIVLCGLMPLIFGEEYNLVVNDPDGVIFDQTDRCDPEEIDCGEAGIVGASILFEEFFETQTNNNPIMGNGWTNYLQEGTQAWEAYTSTGQNASLGRSARVDAAFSGDAATIAWLITPEIDFITNTGETLQFRTSNSFADGSRLTALFSSDWDGDVITITNATWEVLSTAEIVEDDDFFGDWIDSGVVDLSCIIDNGHVAFRYNGSGNSNFDGTYELDEIQIRAN